MYYGYEGVSYEFNAEGEYMILSGKEIVKHMGKEIVIEPFDKSRVNPNSYNLSLYNELMVYERIGYGKTQRGFGHKNS